MRPVRPFGQMRVYPMGTHAARCTQCARCTCAVRVRERCKNYRISDVSDEESRLATVGLKYHTRHVFGVEPLLYPGNRAPRLLRWLSRVWTNGLGAPFSGDTLCIQSMNKDACSQTCARAVPIRDPFGCQILGYCSTTGMDFVPILLETGGLRCQSGGGGCKWRRRRMVKQQDIQQHDPLRKGMASIFLQGGMLSMASATHYWVTFQASSLQRLEKELPGLPPPVYDDSCEFAKNVKKLRESGPGFWQDMMKMQQQPNQDLGYLSHLGHEAPTFTAEDLLRRQDQMVCSSTPAAYIHWSFRAVQGAAFVMTLQILADQSVYGAKCRTVFVDFVADFAWLRDHFHWIRCPHCRGLPCFQRNPPLCPVGIQPTRIVLLPKSGRGRDFLGSNPYLTPN